MKQILQVFVFVTIGIILLWFGYSILLNGGFSAWVRGGRRKKPGPRRGLPGDPQTCPVCSAKLKNGEQVSSLAFPSMNGGKDRFMHIRGCVYCLRGERERVCPVCGIILKEDEILISRLFERFGRRSHVHVLGCSQCKGPRSGRHS